jgi:hypothetical protein
MVRAGDDKHDIVVLRGNMQETTTPIHEEWSGHHIPTKRVIVPNIRQVTRNKYKRLFSEYTELQEIKTNLNVNLKGAWYAR